MAILAGLGFIVFPFAELISGQLYKFGGYYLVYGVSLVFSIIGVVYVIFIPESVMVREDQKLDIETSSDISQTSDLLLDDKEAMNSQLKQLGFGGKLKFIFNHGNKLVWRAMK